MGLSIIIVSYNTAELLRRCLNSLKSEIRNPKSEIEIAVVDNGSSDGSVEVVKDFIDRNSRQFAKIRDDSCEIRLIENKENLGFSKAVNQGIKVAGGETILLLNSDTQIRPKALERLLEFEEKVRPAIIGARLLNPDGSVQPSVFHLPTIGGAVKEYWFGRKGEFSKYAPAGSEPVVVEAVVGGAMLISKGVIDKIGLLDERYFMYFEDLDFCRRAAKSGFKVWYLPSAEIIHEHGASGRDLMDPKDQWTRLIPSSKTYHGAFRHYLVSFIIWIGQKTRKN